MKKFILVGLVMCCALFTKQAVAMQQPQSLDNLIDQIKEKFKQKNYDHVAAIKFVLNQNKIKSMSSLESLANYIGQKKAFGDETSTVIKALNTIAREMVPESQSEDATLDRYLEALSLFFSSIKKANI